MEPILHITNRTQWQKALEEGMYRGDTLDSEGFIHGSTRKQVAEVANRLFSGQTDLLLVYIDPARLGPRVVRENLDGGTEQYPHIYGAVNLDSVIGLHAFEPGEDGRFVMPPAWPRNRGTELP